MQCSNPLERKYPANVDPVSLSQVECPLDSSYELCFKDDVTDKYYGLALERGSRFGSLERVGQKSDTVRLNEIELE